MTSPSRRPGLAALLIAAGLLLATGWWWSRPRDTTPAVDPQPARPARGGALVATLRSEPATFNRYTGAGFPTHVITGLLHASLVRINRVTQELEPDLAESFQRSDDGLRYAVRLREGLRFSDGTPLTTADVVFSFAAAYDAKAGSTLGDSLRIGGRPLHVEASGPRDLTVTFPQAYGPGLRVLDTLPIYPRHRLEPSLAQGTFAEAWGPRTPPGDIAGLGPFVLEQYQPGQRLVFSRNPHFWRRDEDGQQLPYLDRLTLEIVPDQNAELLRLQAGQADLLQAELRPEDYAPVKREADAGRLRLIDVGPSLDTHLFWFNLREDSGTARPWLRADDFRRALSYAVDRPAMARAVYLGAAEPVWGPITPANKAWYSDEVPRPPQDLAEAARLLDGLGLRDADGNGTREGPGGAPVRFSVLVQKGVTASERGAAFLRDEFARVGVALDVVALDLGTMMGRWVKGEYDAVYHWLIATDTDPAGNMDFWLSSGSMHVWHPGQPAPATAWEGELDALMRRQAASLDPRERRAIFAEVQRLFAAHAPALAFAVPHVYVATSMRVAAPQPSPQRPQLLWRPERLAVVPARP